VRSVAYFITGMQQREPATRLIWFLATIESVLRTSSKSLIEERAKAALNFPKSELTGDIRKLYKLRNEFLHGSKNLQIILGGSELYPRGGYDGDALMWWYDEAYIAQEIALSLVQVYFDMNHEELIFETKLKQ